MLKYDENGNCIENPVYKEIHLLDKLLSEAEIPHTMKRFFDGWQVCYPCDGSGRIMDAIEHYGSYGKDEDLLEIMGLLTPEEEQVDNVLGHLSAQEVFNRIEGHYRGIANA